MAEEIDEFFGLAFTIDGFEDTSLTNGENAFIIYLNVDNKIPKSRKINLLKATYVTSKREQLEQDIWILGYIMGEDTLKPNSFKKAGLVFYKSKLKAISENDLIYISIELTQEGGALSLCFQRKGNNWIIIDKEKADIEIKLTPKQLEKSLFKCIERLEVFEERLGVSIQSVSININDATNWPTLFCELHSSNGTAINEWITVDCILYDKDGLVISEAKKMIDPKKFFAFEVIKLQFTDVIAEEISKIRLYPKKY